MEEEKSREVELTMGDLLGILRQCWIFMLAVAIVTGVALYIFLNATHKDEYTAQATIHVGSGGESSNSMSTSDYTIADKLVHDCLSCAKQTSTLKKVIKNAGLFMEPGELSKKVNATNQSNTRFIFVSVSAADPEEAAMLTTELAEVICSEMNKLAGNEPCKVFAEAAVPETISNPVSKLTILLIAAVAAVLVYAIYLIMFLMDDKINSPEDVEKYLRLSVLGQIPNKHDASRRKKYYGYEYGTSKQGGKTV